jgi:hypothetical protein
MLHFRLLRLHGWTNTVAEIAEFSPVQCHRKTFSGTSAKRAMHIQSRSFILGR